MKPLISVIVPVYNVEKYLNRCVDSILNQTYKNLEIILVNDDSPDNCPQLCEKYKLMDKRIRVIHQENQGLSGARNSGIDIATGDYIGFVDSDDYIDNKMYEKLLKNAIDFEADVSICRYIRFKGEVCKDTFQVSNKTITYSTIEVLEKMYSWDGEIYTVAWNKLYRKDTIGDIRYPLRKVNEDEFTTYKMLGNAKKIVFIDEILYYYFQNENSITTNSRYLLNKDIYEALDERKAYYSKHGYTKLCYLVEKQFLDRIISRYKKLLNARVKDKKELKKFKYIYRDRYNSQEAVKGIGYRLFYISPKIYYGLLIVKSKIFGKSGYSKLNSYIN